MKALDILKADRDYCLAINNDKSIIEQYNEAIKELEELQNRSCANCKYGLTYHFDDDIECGNFGADTQGIYFEKDFYCNKWELK